LYKRSSDIINAKEFLSHFNEQEVGCLGFKVAFLFYLFYFMKYVLDCVNERSLQIEIDSYDTIKIGIADENAVKIVFIDERGLYELIGALHHIQKQIKSDK
jgi:hypothetical protein